MIKTTHGHLTVLVEGCSWQVGVQTTPAGFTEVDGGEADRPHLARGEADAAVRHLYAELGNALGGLPESAVCAAFRSTVPGGNPDAFLALAHEIARRQLGVDQVPSGG